MGKTVHSLTFFVKNLSLIIFAAQGLALSELNDAAFRSS